MLAFIAVAARNALTRSTFTAPRPLLHFPMLAPRASNAFVCIRCELQLARRQLPACARRPSHTNFSASHANFSTSARRRDGADEQETPSQAPTTSLRIRKEVEPLNRLRKRKGKVIRETSARLGGLKTLGDDADILVLREVEQDDKPAETTKAPESEPEPAEPVTVPDIIASIQQEHEMLTPEEIQSRIDSLRPKTRAEPDELHFITTTAFVKLTKRLKHDFTHSQLVHYYSATKDIESESYNKKLLKSLKKSTGTGTSKSLTTRTEWQPGTTPIEQRLPGVDVTTRSRRVPVSKQLLVDRIVRDVWKLVPLEELEAPGEIELSLKPWHLALLKTGDETILDRISKERKARFEIYQPHSILRITADKSTAEYAANDVEEALKSTDSKKLQLKPWIPYLERDKVPEDEKLAALYTQQDLDMVTSLTRTSIQRMDNANTLVIRGLSNDAVAEAERTLIRLLPLKDSVLYTLDGQQPDVMRKSGHLMPTSVDEKSLDHKQRNNRLGRWTAPIPKNAHLDHTKGQDSEDHSNAQKAREMSVAVKNRLARVLKSLRQPGDHALTTPDAKISKKDQGYWTTTPEYKLSAEFGHALFPLDVVTPNETAKADHSSSTRPVFAPSTLGLTSLLTAAHLRSSKNENAPAPYFQALSRTESPALLYGFVASPEQQNFDAGQTFPSLHIQMRTSRTGAKAVLHKLSLGFKEHIHDVLLPSKAADIRYVRYGRLRLRKGHNHPQVMEWTNAVCENISSGERLTAPSLSLEIPKWTIPGQPADAKGMRHVTYLFSGVQFRQVVSANFLDTLVSYSTTQSGKLGARGGSLSMYYGNVGQSTQTLYQDEYSLKSFIKKTFTFADKITEAAAQTQPALRMMRPRAEHSERKARRSAESRNDRLAEEDEQKTERSEDVRRVVPGNLRSEVSTYDLERQDMLGGIIEGVKDTMKAEGSGNVEHSMVKEMPDSHATSRNEETSHSDEKSAIE